MKLSGTAKEAVADVEISQKAAAQAGAGPPGSGAREDGGVERRYGSWEVARCRSDSDELVHDSASRQRYGCAVASNMLIAIGLP
jgi:hypothetical protein